MGHFETFEGRVANQVHAPMMVLAGNTRSPSHLLPDSLAQSDPNADRKASTAGRDGVAALLRGARDEDASIRYVLPSALVPWLQFYLAEVRPGFPREPCMKGCGRDRRDGPSLARCSI